MHVTISIELDGDIYEADLAVITATHLGQEDHGIFTGMLTFRSLTNGYSQSNPGRGLDEYDPETKTRKGIAYGMDWIRQVITAAGVTRWEKLIGTKVWVLKKPGGGNIIGIASVEAIGNYMIFPKHADSWYPDVAHRS